jgi:hypothetical protein
MRIRRSLAWGGNPIVDHRTLEIECGRVFARFWMRPFTGWYHFATYGPHCFGLAWLSGMIFIAPGTK